MRPITTKRPAHREILKENLSAVVYLTMTTFWKGSILWISVYIIMQ